MSLICTKRESLWATTKMKNNVFGRNNKSRLSAFRDFLFCQNKIYVLTELWVFFYLEWCFFVKKVSFRAKTADGKSMETETTTSEFPNGDTTFVVQILASEKRNKFKRAELWESNWHRCYIYILIDCCKY